MSEDFLYYCWKHQLFDQELLTSNEGEALEIVKRGERNTSSGPDFANAQIRIANTLWAGNIEIHVKSSDWNLHQHTADEAYNTVILHVVFENDTDIVNQKGEKIPVLELKNRINPSLLAHYERFLQHFSFIPCEKTLIHYSNEFKKSHWITRMNFERLESKTDMIQQLLQTKKNDWEAVLFHLLARYFSSKSNREAMEIWANSFDFSILKKSLHKPETAEALLMGQAGFLEKNHPEDAYFKKIKTEYQFLKEKFSLQPCSATMFKFYGVRPPNYPTVRIIQLMALYQEYQHLFSLLMGISTLEKIYPIFEVSVPQYWKNHYQYGKISSKNQERSFTQSFIDLLIINVILPLKYAYYQHIGKELSDEFEQILTQIKPEKNHIIKGYEELNFKANTAWETQGLLQLYNQYCTLKQCLQCELGSEMLQKR